MKLLFIFFFLFTGSVSAQLQVESFRNDLNQNNDAAVIQASMDALANQGHGSLSFDGSRTYKINRSIELPRYTGEGRKIYVINGNGAIILAGSDTLNIFNRIPQNQKEALGKMIGTRFIIQDLSFIGGAKGINLGGTLGSSILRCNFTNIRIAAIDIQFGLQTVISHCYATNCFEDNFILRTGEDWGGNSNNSQSNHSVIEYSRVYARKESKTGYKILGSGGIVLRDIISEGSHEIDYAIFADRLKSTTVRYFKIENLHLEHAPLKAGIYLSITGNTEINGIFYQHARKVGEFTLIHAGEGSGLINVASIPHFVTGTVMRLESPGCGFWNLNFSAKEFYLKENWRIKKADDTYESKLPFYFSGQGGGAQVKIKY
ncbi:MAG: hypothetical protein H0V01_15760 [Bacteroidetes bacterium]|nr:hypothetical protein [Bacteroidota bacterium]HET6245280.1 hypothetical protein [Bacteroidia bacterium]